MRDELEFEKETRNTFISLIMSIQEKRRQLNLDNAASPLSSTSTSSSFSPLSNQLHHKYSNFSIINYNKKPTNKNSSSSSSRRSLINFSLDFNNPTHLTTIIPYNSEIVYTVQHLQILNKRNIYSSLILSLFYF